MTTFVYSLFDEHDEFIYVGMTDHLGSRLATHQRYRDWWSEVHRVEVLAHETREKAASVERFIVETYLPRHNVHWAKGARASAADGTA